MTLLRDSTPPPLSPRHMMTPQGSPASGSISFGRIRVYACTARAPARVACFAPSVQGYQHQKKIPLHRQNRGEVEGFVFPKKTLLIFDGTARRTLCSDCVAELTLANEVHVEQSRARSRSHRFSVRIRIRILHFILRQACAETGARHGIG